MLYNFCFAKRERERESILIAFASRSTSRCALLAAEFTFSTVSVCDSNARQVRISLLVREIRKLRSRVTMPAVADWWKTWGETWMKRYESHGNRLALGVPDVLHVLLNNSALTSTERLFPLTPSTLGLPLLFTLCHLGNISGARENR